MGDRISIHLEVYLPFRGRSVWRGEEQMGRGTTVKSLLLALGINEPALAVLVNGRLVSADRELEMGDRVAILRQAEGG